MRTTMSKTACIIAAANSARHHAGHANPEILVSLTKDQVQHIAMLARLELAEQEFDDVVAKLSRIVDFVDQLQAAPTADVLPMAHPLNQAQRLRPDQVTESNQRDVVQANAGAVQNGFYLVPKVIE
jgi:aspartyl-tRNA(Asn)/glutamyl-tRNA(Gln) amidotransferase subunit C